MYKIDYLLKYVSNDCYKKIVNMDNEILLDSLEHFRIDVDLNIRYLIKMGIKDYDKVIFDRLEDLTKSHSEFRGMVDSYIDTMGNDGFISMIENV
jgi:hypothetical protein